MDGVLLVLIILYTLVKVVAIATRPRSRGIDIFYFLVGSVIIWTPILVIVHFVVKYW